MLDSMRANAQSWGVKVAFGIIILVFVFWGIGTSQAPTGVVGTVNGEQITHREFQMVYSRMASQFQEVLPNITEEQLIAIGILEAVSQELIMLKLLEVESERTGIDVSLRSLRNRIDAYSFFKNAAGKFDKELYVQILKTNGQNPASFERGLRQEMLPNLYKTLLSSGLYVNSEDIKNLYMFQLEKRSMDYVLFPYDIAAQKVSQEAIAKTYEEQKQLYALPARLQLEYINFDPEKMASKEKITQSELEKAYNERQDSFMIPAQVKARHILLTLAENASEEDAKKVLDSIKNIEQKLRDGADFNELSKQFSQDGAAQKGGDLGWFAKEQMVGPFAEAAFTLDIGQISTPVKTNFGYHLIVVDAKKDEYTQTLKEVEDDLRILLATEKINDSLQDTVDNALTTLLGSKDVQKDFTALAKKHALQFETSELLDVANLAEALDMRPADVQILMTAPKGRVWDTAIGMASGLSVVRISESLPAMTKPLSEVENSIKTSIATKMAHEAAMNKAKIAIVKNISKKDSFKGMVKQSGFIGRDGVWDDMGQNKELAKELFASDDKEWKSAPFRMNKGVVAIRLDKIAPVNESEFLDVQTQLVTRVNLEQANFMYDAFIFYLRLQADIDILMPEFFKPSHVKL